MARISYYLMYKEPGGFEVIDYPKSTKKQLCWAENSSLNDAYCGCINVYAYNTRLSHSWHITFRLAIQRKQPLIM